MHNSTSQGGNQPNKRPDMLMRSRRRTRRGVTPEHVAVRFETWSAVSRGEQRKTPSGYSCRQCEEADKYAADEEIQQTHAPLSSSERMPLVQDEPHAAHERQLTGAALRGGDEPRAARSQAALSGSPHQQMARPVLVPRSARRRANFSRKRRENAAHR